MKDIYLKFPDPNDYTRALSKNEYLANFHIRMGNCIYHCHNVILNSLQQNHDYPRSMTSAYDGYEYAGIGSQCSELNFTSDWVDCESSDEALQKFEIYCNRQPEVIEVEKIVEKEKIVYKEKYIPTHTEILHANYGYYMMML